MPSDELLGIVIHFLRNAQIRGSADAVVGGVRLALMLGHGKQRSIPDLASHARRVVDGNPKIVADFRTWNALGLIFGEKRIPFAG